MLDVDFISDRIHQCILICNAHIKRGFENECLFHRVYEQAERWLKIYESKTDHSAARSVGLRFLLDEIYEEYSHYLTQQSLFDLEEDLFFEELQAHNEKNQQVPKPAPSAQLSVFRVLGQVTKTQVTLGTAPLSIDWRPTDPMPSKLFSITRPVGGLEQCQ